MSSILGRSPVFNHTSSSMNGLTTIRAHKCQENIQEMFNSLQDIHISVSCILTASIRWFAVWIDLICAFYITCVTIYCVYLRESKLIQIAYMQKSCLTFASTLTTNRFKWQRSWTGYFLCHFFDCGATVGCSSIN